MDYGWAFRLQFLSMGEHLSVWLSYHCINSFQSWDLCICKIFIFFSRKHTSMQKTISLDFITGMSFCRLYKGNNNKDGFYCKVLD